jgi:hypothetical protein
MTVFEELALPKRLLAVAAANRWQGDEIPLSYGAVEIF